MRIATGLITLLVAVGTAVPASAHRLDEYLQALRVDLRANGIVVELDLTPGANLAADVVATLDPNGDGAIDRAEADAYVGSVLHGLELSVDDRRVDLDVISRTVPSIDEVREGAGVISLVTRADVDQPPGRHRVRVSNAYRSDVGAYLANALRPDSRAITITSQLRDPRQQTLTIDYLVGVPLAARASGWTAIALALLGCSLYWRRRDQD